MKTTNLFKLAALFLFLGTFTACVQDDDYTVPTIVETGSNITDPALGNHAFDFPTIFGLQAAAGGILEFDSTVVPATGDSYITGYVISNDQAGNFYKSIYIQDSPVNPTAGITISVDAYDTYLKYNVGRKVYVKLNGLAIDKINGVMTIGVADGTSLARISSLNLEDAVQRDTMVETIVPTTTTTVAVNAGTVPDGILVEIPNMQVPVGDLGLTYANIANTFSVNRNLTSCDDNGIVIIRNSGYADFKNVPMPNGKGTLTAVLSNYNTSVQLYIRGTEDLDFTGPRCDPLFSENFNSLAAWTAFSVTGAEVWGIDTFSGSVAKMSGYAGSAQINEDWLISPAIDLSTAIAPVLSFDNLKRYNGFDIEVFMSTDYAGSGDPTVATWTPLTAILDTNTGSWSSWTNSGDIDISAALGGDVYIAFKYTSDLTQAGIIELDNVLVKEL